MRDKKYRTKIKPKIEALPPIGSRACGWTFWTRARVFQWDSTIGDEAKMVATKLELLLLNKILIV